jgi:hypothetical protein
MRHPPAFKRGFPPGGHASRTDRRVILWMRTIRVGQWRSFAQAGRPFSLVWNRQSSAWLLRFAVAQRFAARLPGLALPSPSGPLGWQRWRTWPGCRRPRRRIAHLHRVEVGGQPHRERHGSSFTLSHSGHVIGRSAQPVQPVRRNPRTAGQGLRDIWHRRRGYQEPSSGPCTCVARTPPGNTAAA